MFRRVNLTVRAEADIEEILLASEREFGELASQRYAGLFTRAIRGLVQADPSDHEVLGLPEGLFARHLARYRRDDDGRIAVKNPRHYLVFRMRDADVEVLRVLHDAADLSRLSLDPSDDTR
jgi:plasmid stabilization system protein ParE